VAAQDGNMIGVRLSSTDQLFLTEVEVGKLVEIVHHELNCRTVAQANNLVTVADICLTTTEAWELVDRLNNLAAEEVVDWPTEGF
jgi:hypothetical protein